MRIDDELIDSTLKSAPAWQPPAGFAERIAARGVGSLHDDVAVPRFWSWANVAAVVPLAVVTALGVYFAGELMLAITPAIAFASASTPVATWLWVAGSCGVAAWFAQAAYAAA